MKAKRYPCDELNVEILWSRRDRAGNNYFAFTATHPDTGKNVSAKISGGESNIYQAQFYVRGRWPVTGEPRWYVTDRSLGVREFERLTKCWPYAGCKGEDLLVFMKEHLL